MEGASQHSPKRLLRLVIAGGVLATAWFAIDALTHSEPAAAAETIDLLPVGDGSAGGVVNGVLGEVTTLVAPVTSALPPAVTTVTAPVEPVVTQVVAPVLSPAVTVVDGITSPIVAPVVGSVGEALAPIATNVINPLSPVLVAVTAPLVPTFAEVVDPLTVLDAAIDLAQSVPTIRPNTTVLAMGGSVILGVVLGAIVAPLLPAPSNGGPLGVPLAPAAPSGSNGSSSVGLYGELNSGVPAGIGAFGTVGADANDLPPFPVFESDTTPD